MSAGGPGASVPGPSSFWARLAARPALTLGLATLALHLWADGGYGFFRDELYFIVCGRHLAWGYVDQPPLTPLIALVEQSLFGPSLRALRLVPALGAAGAVALTCAAAAELGGGRFARWLAGLCVLAGPYFRIVGVLLFTDAIEPVAWLGLMLLLLRQLRAEATWRWVAFGLLLGVLVLDKYAVVFYGATVAAGLAATPERRVLLRPGAWLACALALAVAAPNLAWQAAEGWPFLELGKAAVEGKNLAYSPVGFVAELALLLNPATLPVWLLGLLAAGFDRRFAALRFLPLSVAALVALFIVIHGKTYYAATVFPLVFAVGAAAAEARLRAAWPRAALAALVAVGFVVLLPFGVPVLPVAGFVAWEDALGLKLRAGERGELGPLPQYYADMFGWPELARKVGEAYQALPPEDQARAVFFGNNYGEAAAVDVLGAPWHLPPAISGHNNYFLWGPQGHDGSIVLVIAADPAKLRERFASVEPVGRLDDPYAMPYETNRTIWLCRGLKAPLDTLWPSLKHYD